MDSFFSEKKVHNTPNSCVSSTQDDDIVYAHGNMGTTCVAAWSGSTFQGLGCSPIKAVNHSLAVLLSNKQLKNSTICGKLLKAYVLAKKTHSKMLFDALWCFAPLAFLLSKQENLRECLKLGTVKIVEHATMDNPQESFSFDKTSFFVWLKNPQRLNVERPKKNSSKKTSFCLLLVCLDKDKVHG
jgi:hypothetical protein